MGSTETEVREPKSAAVKTQAGEMLLVDDDPVARFTLAEIFRRVGYLCDVAEDGVQAMRLIELKEYDIILSDIRMPNMDGLELLKAVRAKSTRTVIILITAYGALDSAITALRMGADDYVLKPYDIGYLKRTVASALEARRQPNNLNVKILQDRFGFTPREVEVASQIHSGFSNTAIARNLEISPGTVRIHIEHIYNKMMVHSRTQLLARMRVEGIV